MMTVRGPFDYNPDRWSNRMSSCYLRVYQLPNRIALVIATELAANMGPSITNSAEALATQVVREYGLDPEKTHFVEHYDRRKDGSYGAAVKEFDDESYDFVSFTWEDGRAGHAKWKPASKEIIEVLIGEKLS